MSQILHVLDKGEGKDGKRQVLERFSVDANEIVAADPDRYQILGFAPKDAKGTGAGSTTAVLDNDSPTEVARKILEATGNSPTRAEGESDAVADQDVFGNSTDPNFGKKRATVAEPARRRPPAKRKPSRAAKKAAAVSAAGE